MMNSDNTYNENVDLWSIKKCIFCKGQIGENSKILKCLHCICKNCTQSGSDIQCKCGIVTNGTSSTIHVKTEIEENESSIDSDSDSSEYTPFVYCSCCVHGTEDLIKCNDCDRSYHYDCHIPSIDRELLLPDNPQKAFWKCTLCSHSYGYSSVLMKRNVTAYCVSGYCEQRVIEFILMKLYCQNGDSVHYRECLDRELYPWYYERITDPISLNDIKRRLESTTSYTSFINLLKDINKVFINGMFYYTETDPYHTSARLLQITFFKLLRLLLPNFDISLLGNP